MNDHELSLIPPALPALPSDRPVVTLAEAARAALSGPGVHAYVGAEGAAAPLLAHALLRAGAGQLLYVAPNADTARRARADLQALCRGLPGVLGLPAVLGAGPLLLPVSETSPYAQVHPDRRTALLRAAALFHLARGLPWQILIVTAAGLTRKVPPPARFAAAGLELLAEDCLDLDQTVQQLSAVGYLRAPVVEDPGTFAVRGGIFDVWPSGAELPVRAELYDDLLVSLRVFNPDDQRTQRELARTFLPPAREAVIDAEATARARECLRALCDQVNFPSSKARALIEDLATGRAFYGSDGYLPGFFPLVSLFAYLPENLPVVVEDPVSTAEALREEWARAEEGEKSRTELPHFGLSELFVRSAEISAALAARPLLLAHRSGVAGPSGPDLLQALEQAPIDGPTLAIHDHGDLARDVKLARQKRGKHGALDPLIERIHLWQEAGLGVVIAARSDLQAERLGTLLSHRRLRVQIHPSTEAEASVKEVAHADTVHVLTAGLSRGALVLTESLVFITEEEIFGQRAERPRAPKRLARALLEDLRALEPGDYVVHVDHGIGRYLGLERKALGGVNVDLLVVEYAGGKLFLPIYRLNQVEKYTGAEGTPRLDRLGGQTFAKTKARVQKHVRKLADQLLRLYAERAALKKDPLPDPDDDYAAFEASFPFEETRDQATAIADVLGDLRSERVMDRLICGDVGFGKTEVALRAAFLNALAGRQVALLCPTTVLAQQHFLTFSNRLQDYPVSVRALSRFQSRSEQLDTLKGLREGQVDVVVGTHRLLSKDVHFKNLGLLVVDEEQRFGVTHKERIKQLRAAVDVLTLTATPIPRTLQLAVGGLRDMSLISTPPVDRRAVRTIISQFDPDLVKEAVNRELLRGGQIFYVYNRIEGIYERAERLRTLVPSARIAIAHGQVSEEMLERTMLDFVEGMYDILVATAIIESGLDIPRANTIIIDRADLFGLAQLYQLRGRVGRASERAYAYLLVPPPSQMSDEARYRLEALERHTELGSGFQIAALDLELRGTGDLLGAEQSGFVASVGFELFCQMLNEATQELSGEVVVPGVDPELSFDVEALLPEDYIGEVGVRLSLYKRLAGAADAGTVEDLALEMEDRFGPPPVEARRLVELMRLKTELRRLRVLGCEATARSVTLHLSQDTPLEAQKIGQLLAQKKSPYRLSPDGKLTRRALPNEPPADGLSLADRMLAELAHYVKD